MHNKLSFRGTVGVLVGVMAFGLFGAQAFAAGYDATSATRDITSLITTNIPLVATLTVAVAGLLVGFYLLQWGVKTVMHKIKRGVHI